LKKFKRAYYDAEYVLSLPEEQRDYLLEAKVWKNDVYTVAIRDSEYGFIPLKHLSIRRNDRETIHDWRDLQTIKNMLVGPEREGIEIYPAESRLVDTANQYHLWVFPIDDSLGIGFDKRQVLDDGEVHRLIKSMDGAKQRPFKKG